MKKQRFIKLLFGISFALCPFFAKAQIDTAWVTNEHASQYIFPSIIDEINYNNQPDTNRIAQVSSVVLMNTLDYTISYNAGNPIGIAQKFEIEHGDSVSLMGVAAVLLTLPSTYGIFDTIKISILNGRFAAIFKVVLYL